MFANETMCLLTAATIVSIQTTQTICGSSGCTTSKNFVYHPIGAYNLAMYIADFYSEEDKQDDDGEPKAVFIFDDGTYTTKSIIKSYEKPISQIYIDDGSIASKLKINIMKIMGSDYKVLSKMTFDIIEYIIVCNSVVLYVLMVGLMFLVGFRLVIAIGRVIWWDPMMRIFGNKLDYNPLGIRVPEELKSEIDETTEDTSQECKICYKNIKKVICVPCGHMYMCVSCSREYAKMTRPKCGLCRKDVTMCVRVLS